MKEKKRLKKRQTEGTTSDKCPPCRRLLSGLMSVVILLGLFPVMESVANAADQETRYGTGIYPDAWYVTYGNADANALSSKLRLEDMPEYGTHEYWELLYPGHEHLTSNDLKNRNYKLTGGNYFIQEDLSHVGANATDNQPGESGLAISSSNGDVLLVLEKTEEHSYGPTLTFIGGRAADGQNGKNATVSTAGAGGANGLGAGAGIEWDGEGNQDATLWITGVGRIVCTGGNAGNGGTGGNATGDNTDVTKANGGGGGGAGGGAGAGIGTKGAGIVGTGGAGTIGKSDKYIVSSVNADNGTDGGRFFSSKNISVTGLVTVTAKGGDEGVSGAGGKAESASISGGGGGGGGAGGKAANIGQGGSSGGSGGGGTGGYDSTSAGQGVFCGNGGGGGAAGGTVSSQSTYVPIDKEGGKGGAGGTGGTTTSGTKVWDGIAGKDATTALGANYPGGSGGSSNAGRGGDGGKSIQSGLVLSAYTTPQVDVGTLIYPLNECKVEWEVDEALLNGGTDSFAYTGQAVRPKIRIIHIPTGEEVPESYYTVSYQNNINGGMAVLKIRGANSTYQTLGTSALKPYKKADLSLTFAIKYDKEKISIALKDGLDYTGYLTAGNTNKGYAYTGTTLEPEIQFYYNGAENMIPTEAYSVSWSGNNQAATMLGEGTAGVTIIPVGDYWINMNAPDFTDTFDCVQAPEIITPSGELAAITPGEEYCVKLESSGTKPLRWTCEGTLPTGITFNTETGTFEGTVEGMTGLTGSVKVTASNPAGTSAEKVYTWKRNTFEVRFDPDGGMFPENVDTIVSGSAGSTQSAPVAPSKTGYFFDGWYRDPTDEKTRIAAAGTFQISAEEGVVYTAKWTPVIYTLRFEANNGSGDLLEQTYTVEMLNAKLTANNFTAGGDKKFIGWALSPKNTAAEFNDGETVTGLLKETLLAASNNTLTLYAVWSDKNPANLSIRIEKSNSDAFDLTGGQKQYDGEALKAVISKPEDLPEDEIICKWEKKTVDGSYAEIAAAPKDAGDYRLTATVKESNDTYAGSASATVKILKVIITVKAEGVTLASGSALPKTYTLTYIGGSESDFSVPPTAAANVTNTSAAGTYEIAITPGTLKDEANYEAVYENGTLKIEGRKTSTVSVPISPKDDSCKRDDSCPLYPFEDADRSAWYHDGAHYCVERGLIAGMPGSKFAPEQAITRAQIVTILYRVEHSPAVKESKAFTDVSSGAWYGDAISWAAENGIVNGYSDGTFAPNAPITREQFAAILFRYASYKGYRTAESTNLSEFTDHVQLHTYAESAMSWACARKLITGMTATQLVPQGNATRAQASMILCRFFTQAVKQ